MTRSTRPARPTWPRVARKLWAQRGFAQTSVETIARKAGIAKGTPYLDFDSKGALLLS